MLHTMQAEMRAVVSLWRYPVKSMIGEELPTAQVTEHGLLGDRAYALIDRADGKVATTKNPANGRRSSRAAPPFWSRQRAMHQRHRSASRSMMAPLSPVQNASTTRYFPRHSTVKSPSLSRHTVG
jgi:uncharacterized protein YcbX